MSKMEKGAVGAVKRRGNFAIMREMFALLAPLKREMCLAILLGVLGFILAFSLGLVGSYLVLAALRSVPAFNIPEGSLIFSGYKPGVYAAVLIAAALLRGMFHYGEQFCNHLIAFKVLANIRVRVFKCMQKLVPAKLESKNKGELIGLIMGDIELLEVFYAHTVSPIGIALLTTVVLFAFNFALHPYFAFTALALQLLMAVVLPLWANGRSQTQAREIRASIAQLNGQLLDQLRGVRELVRYSQEEACLRRVADISQELIDNQAELRENSARVQRLTDVLVLGGALSQFALAAYMTAQSLVHPAVAFMAVMSVMSTFAPYISLAALGVGLTQTLACGERVLSLLEEEPEVAEQCHGTDASYGEILVDDVDFAYEDEGILQNCSLRIARGEHLGIMGPSGCGKSSLLKLMLRFRDPCSGSIKLNGYALPELNTRSLYKRMIYLTQDVQLFTGALRDNLLLVKEDATDAELWAALEKASLADYIRSLPKGLDCYISELADNFSGGERQRMSLARCFLSEAEILLLDEPTSNLDCQNEAVILKAIAEQMRERTVVLVSHRPSSLSICDRVLKFNDGRLQASEP